MNATTAASTTGQRGSARAAIVAVALIAAAAVAGVATGNLLQQALNRSSGTVLSTDAYRSLHAMHAIEAAAAANLSAVLATEAYGRQHVERITAAGAPAISDWPDLGSRMVTKPLITDTFRFTGPSRVQSAGLAAALATEAYGLQHVERMGAAAGSTTTFSTEDYRAQHPVQAIGTPAIEDWPDEAGRLVKPAPLSDTFRFTGGSRVE